MSFLNRQLPYRQANCYSGIVLDYIDHAAALRGFYLHPPSLRGIEAAIAERKNFDTDRNVLAGYLADQYKDVPASERVNEQIETLRSPKTFTITTAHQPNLFTGPLYSIYKILHTIRLAAHCNEQLPNYHFVPVFYMGSEDADLEELGHCWVGGQKLTWNTKQSGAVGRMKVDKEVLGMIDQISGQVGVDKHGEEIVQMLRTCYTQGSTIQEATFRFLHLLFGEKGLVVLIADHPDLKIRMRDLFKEDILEQRASGLVEKTAADLSESGYKVQANPRAINLFYLKDDIRERIEQAGNEYLVNNTNIRFSRSGILEELEVHPERFSPNVILRGIYQETILPNVVFVGGGGELAYWLQLKDLFSHAGVPYPVLVLRNSFLLIEKKWQERIQKTGFEAEDFFLSHQELMNRLVIRESEHEVKLNGSFSETEQVFEKIMKQAEAVDPSLRQHTEALKVKMLKRLKQLEKKMIRAEKRKFSDRERQITHIREQLFPKNGLQERIDNMIPYYAKWGSSFLDELYHHSLSLEQEFIILTEK